MLTPDQELESRANPEAPLCANCGNAYEHHFESLCHCGISLTWMGGCLKYEPMGLEYVLDDEGKI